MRKLFPPRVVVLPIDMRQIPATSCGTCYLRALGNSRCKGKLLGKCGIRIREPSDHRLALANKNCELPLSVRCAWGLLFRSQLQANRGIAADYFRRLVRQRGNFLANVVRNRVQPAHPHHAQRLEQPEALDRVGFDGQRVGGRRA